MAKIGFEAGFCISIKLLLRRSLVLQEDYATLRFTLAIC
jgi:hypothetical protein